MLSPLEKLKKFLFLESERGFDNRAVVGGLDKILPTWMIDASGSGVPASTVQAVKADLVGLTANLTVISGIGPKTAQTLEHLGLRTLEDLLYYFPRRYDDYSQLKTINRLKYGDEVSVLVNVKSTNTRNIHGGKRTMTEAVVKHGNEELRLTFGSEHVRTKSTRPTDQLVL